MNANSAVQMQRYELPTCVLELWAERSPLSEWSDKPVAKNLKFRLQVAGQIIRGNQKRLEELIEAVTNYVDAFLSEAEISSLKHTVNLPKYAQLHLSTLELFDLIANLEHCTSELTILPSVNLEIVRFTPAWLQIAALLVVTVGVTTSAIKIFAPPFSSQVATSSKQDELGSKASAPLPVPTRLAEAQPPDLANAAKDSKSAASTQPNLKNPSENPTFSHSERELAKPANSAPPSQLSKLPSAVPVSPSKVETPAVPSASARAPQAQSKTTGDIATSNELGRVAQPIPQLPSPATTESNATERNAAPMPSQLASPRRDRSNSSDISKDSFSDRQSISGATSSTANNSNPEVGRVTVEITNGDINQEIIQNLRSYLQGLNLPATVTYPIQMTITLQNGRVMDINFIDGNSIDGDTKNFLERSLRNWPTFAKATGSLTIHISN